jgi:nucleoside-specific outer membrane channel protein Tsx
MKNLKSTVFIVGFVALYCLLLSSFGQVDPHQQKIREQNNLKWQVNITLRAAHTAYNVEKYELAAENFEIAINKGWIDGIDLYQYADCLAHLGKEAESKVCFQKAFDELTEFYPNHAYLQILKTKGYVQSQ